MQYFHPDHMSSAEKLKLELKRVRDEFKMSESDCGSARVQGNRHVNPVFAFNHYLWLDAEEYQLSFVARVQR